MSANQSNLISDADLLGQYAASRSHGAFKELVERYLPLIYGAAMRQTRDPHLAEDVVQATLMILSEKARGINPATLPGWLLKTTHYTAANAIRARSRRTSHERRAAVMKTESDGVDSGASPDVISRVIDSALVQLRDMDRSVVALRYLQNKSFAEIAAQLGTTESAVQRRIPRAIEKLRMILSREGVMVVPSAFPGVLAAQATHTVPVSFAGKSIFLSSSQNAFSFLVAKGVIHTMNVAKVKTCVAIAAVVLAGALAIPAVYHYAAPPATALARPPLPSGTDMTRPVSGTLPSEIVAEPLAIRRMEDKRWITPTGGEFSELPAAIAKQFSEIKSDGATHAFLFRVTTLSDELSYKFFVEGALPWGASGAYDAKTHTQYCVTMVKASSDASVLTLTMDVAKGPWTNLCSIATDAKMPVQGSVGKIHATFYPPTEEGKRVHLKYETPELSKEYAENFYGITLASSKATWVGQSGDGKGGVYYAFQGPLNSYTEFHLDVRPYNYHATYASVPFTQQK